MYNPGPLQQPVGAAFSSAPNIVPPMTNAQTHAAQGYDGAVGTALTPLVSALMKAKLAQKLQGKLPGTTSQSLGAGTAGSDVATGPQAPPLIVQPGGPGTGNA